MVIKNYPSMENCDLKSLELFHRRPDKSDKWTYYGAGGHGSRPPHNALPLWDQLPLDRKLPVPPHPPTVFFTRGWTGDRLLSKEEAFDLRLYDSEGHSMQLPYAALHDQHLGCHFQRQPILRQMKEKNLISKNGYALCTLQEQNNFREATRMMNLDAVHHGVKIEEEALAEKRRLAIIEENLEKKKDFWDLQQKLVDSKTDRAQNRAQTQKDKIKRFKEQIELTNARIIRLEEIKRQNVEEKVMKSIKKREEIDHKLDALTALEREKRLKLIRKLREREEKLDKQKQRELEEKKGKKEEKVKCLWFRKIDEMNKANAIAQETIQNVIEDHLINVEIRKRRAAIVKQKQENLVETMRQRRSLKRENYQKKLLDEKVKKSILSSWIAKEDLQEKPIMVEHGKKSIELTFKEYARKSTQGADKYIAIVKCRESLQKLQDTPIPVSYVVDYIIEKSIERWVIDILTPEMNNAQKIVLEFSHAYLSQLRQERSKISKTFRREQEENFLRKLQDYEKQSDESSEEGMEGKTSPTEDILEHKNSIDKNTETVKSSRKTAFAIEFDGLEEETTPKHSSRSSFSLNKRSDESNFQKGNRLSKAHESVRFGRVEELNVLTFPENLKSVKGRRMTPAPSLDNLAEIAWMDDPISPIPSNVTIFQEKLDLKKECYRAIRRVIQEAERISKLCIEPMTRLKTIKKLSTIKDLQTDFIVKQLAKDLLENEKKKIVLKPGEKPKETEEQKVAASLAKSAISNVLNPREWNKEVDDYVIQYKVMFVNRGPIEYPESFQNDFKKV